MSTDDITKLEAMHAGIQKHANIALELSVDCIRAARLLGNDLAKHETLEGCTDDLQAWADTYRKVAALAFPDRICEAPALIREAMAELQLIPADIEAT